MAANSRYVIWAHRGLESMFGAASNPVIRNGALLSFDDKRRARVECDRLNTHSGNPYVHYLLKQAKGTRRVRAA